MYARRKYLDGSLFDEEKPFPDFSWARVGNLGNFRLEKKFHAPASEFLSFLRKLSNSSLRNRLYNVAEASVSAPEFF